MPPEQLSASNPLNEGGLSVQPPTYRSEKHSAKALLPVDYSSLPSSVTLNGHTSNIGWVAFSPSDQLIASGSDDRAVKLWDAHLGTHITDLTGHKGPVWSVAFSPDGTILASGSYGSDIKLWDVQAQKEIATFKSGDKVRHVTFSPNGLQLASGLANDTVEIWDVKSRTCTIVLEGHSNWVKSVEFSPDAKRIASGSADATVRIWDVTTGACIQVLDGHSNTVESVAFSPDGELLATGSWDKTIRLWHAATGSHIATLQGHLGNVNSVAFSPDSKYIASASSDKTLRLWHVSSRSHLSTHTGHTSIVWSVAFSPDGSRLVSGSRDKTVRLWNFAQENSSVDERSNTNIQDAPHSESISPLITGPLGDEITGLSSMMASSGILSGQHPLERSTISPGAQIGASQIPVPTTNVEETSPLSASMTLSNDITNQVSLENYDQIGLGGFGGVFLGNHKDHGKVAMKKPHKLFDETEARRFLREVDLWCSVASRYVLPCLGMCRIGPHVYVVSPFIENGDVMSCLARGMDLNRGKLLYEIADALTHLHHKGIVHGDVKAQNVLISDDGSALLCDFGLAKAFDTMKTSTEAKGTGSIRWMAPELFENASRSMATDVYSYGVTIAEVLSGQTPFSDMTDNIAVMCNVLLRDGRPAKSPTHSPSGKPYSVLWDVAEKCWAKEAGSRPNMAQVLGMLFTLARETN